MSASVGTLAQASGDIEATGPNGPLRGTMIMPASDAPVILMIPGSGPTDQDGNSPLGIRAAPYRLLAEGLAEQGIGSVRIDKRGMFRSQGAVPDANAVTIADYVHDTDAWIRSIRARTGAQCVWLLGHSEGGLVALAAAGKVDHLCGLILIATAGRPLGNVLKEQLRANPANAPFLNAADQAIDELSAGRYVNTAELQPALTPLFNPAVQGFLISIFALDPAVLAANTILPILILQGQRDLQVSVADAERLQAAAHATLVTLPDTNHVLKQVTSDEPGANLATYAAADLALAPGVVDAISRFVKTP
ncbi:alpha/beta hydrolase [Ancylobacter sp. A5.8]|uniref:alpha/beta hydrolase n=1 Tax=Ancylobacter gelatini TaxID=2919920 RepID=UPI001F4EEF24|nr:alpha/beta fold hydrolase [Ancylobacter gelatini]MCJ8141735.1 alpha/beta hydrolase [Ancylobacter gelatini]